MKKYQINYAAGRPQMYNQTSRLTRAKRIITLLKDYYQNCISALKILDIGSSTGIIDNELAKKCREVYGVDIDKKAVDFSQKNFPKNNLHFQVGDALNTGFPNNSFDVVVCAQVYEHVSDPKRLFAEIYRVLKPKGICYFAAINSLWPIEAHYNLPFLSILPKPIANYYVKIFGKANKYWETPLNYWQLKKLVSRFEVKDYTDKILNEPLKYGYTNTTIPKTIAKIIKYFAPSFFWILIKEK